MRVIDATSGMEMARGPHLWPVVVLTMGSTVVFEGGTLNGVLDDLFISD
jgi:hypothetical protein